MSWKIGHPIPRDGTSQPQRLPDALRPERNPIDARRTEDLLRYLSRLSEQFAYYNERNEVEGDWQPFFDELKDGDDQVSPASIRRYLAKAEQRQDNSTFMTILLAFLQMFGHLQNDLNTLTQKHLDFYYEQALGFRRLPSRPDEVHVFFELAPHLKQHRLPAGTALKAGTDALGIPLTYVTKREIILNQAKLTDIKTVLVAEDGRIFAANKANSADGMGTPLEGEPKKWPIFGHPDYMQAATVGFAIASPLLLLREGNREIRLSLHFDSLPEGLELTDFDHFLAYGSGEKGWIPLKLEGQLSNQEKNRKNQVNLKIKVPATAPGIVGYNSQKLEGALTTRFPVIRLLLNPDRPKYKVLKKLSLNKIEIKVKVTATTAMPGVRNLIVQNDQGLLDANSAFQPFGAMPVSNALFYIGSNEVFSKPVEKLHIQIQWAENPDGPGGNVKFQLLDNGQWTESFGSKTDLSPEIILQDKLPRLALYPDLAELEEYKAGIPQGFIRLILESDFRHQSYFTELTKYARFGARDEAPPSLPVTPVIQSISLGYSASQIFSPNDFEPTGQFFNLHPFGSEEMTTSSNTPLLPQLDQAALFLGFEKLEPPQNIHLLFQIAEGSAASKEIVGQEDIQWTYLTDQGWREKPLGGSEIFTDTTLGLQKSGVIAFSIGRDADKNARLMPAGKHWLRAIINKNPAGAAQAISIRPQAITAVFQDQNNDPNHLTKPLAANRISSLVVRDSAVKKIEQPYSSFGGLPTEGDQPFYIRVSERLRHKQRAVTFWDIDRLVLQQFPSLYEVKTIPHTGYGPDGYSEFQPGQITVIVIPQLRNQNAVNPLQPGVSIVMLMEIKRYIQLITTPFVSQPENALHVLNPLYEPILLSFSVAFNEGYDAGYYSEVLNEALRRRLSPWAFEEGVDIRFGGKIYKSQLLAFVEEEEYVDYVTEFKMIHYKRDPGIEEMIVEIDLVVRPDLFERDTDVAEASTAASILVSAEKHLINILKPDEYHCDEPDMCIDGIGCWYIEVDFTVSN